MYLQGMKDNRARPFRKAEHGCVRLLFRALIVRLKSLRVAFKIGYVVLPYCDRIIFLIMALEA